MSVHPAGARQCHHVVVLTYARPLGRQNIMEVNLFVETAEPIKRHSAADCMDSCMEHANPNYAPQQLLSKYIPNQMVFVRPLCTSVQFSSVQKDPTSKCHTLMITTTQIPSQTKQHPVSTGTPTRPSLLFISAS